jgi:hypothetical protein
MNDVRVLAELVNGTLEADRTGRRKKLSKKNYTQSGRLPSPFGVRPQSPGELTTATIHETKEESLIVAMSAQPFDDPLKAREVNADDFDFVADLEGQYYRQGEQEGALVGRLQGLEEGKKLGYSKGFSLASEVGFYLGVIDMVSCLSVPQEGTTSASNTSEPSSSMDSEAEDSVKGSLLSEKLKRSLEAVKSIATNLDESGALKVDVLEQLHNIRSKFKLLMSQLGLKIRYGGTTVDRVAEDQLPAGMPSVEF